MMKKYTRSLLFLSLIAGLFGLVISAVNAQSDPAAKIPIELQSQLDGLAPGETITVIVKLTDQAVSKIPGRGNITGRPQAVIEALQAQAHISQQGITALLEAGSQQGKVQQVVPFWVFNGLSVTATTDVIQQLAARDDVQSITPDAIDVMPAGQTTLSAPAGNISAINAPALWNLGYYGQGVVVANMDTGVDASHPELGGRWRGGTNSWYDPYNQHPLTPTDLNGHGTWTMGVMVAADASGTSLGVAPQAQWIAAKIFNDSGSATATGIHLAYQWLLDPDGNPATADSPQVVNNSWTFSSPGCNLEFQYDLQALRLAGILPVFAAGNFGPNGFTSASPANYPEAFAIGSVDNSGTIQVSSSRGPSACGESTSIYPEVVAPGANITTTDLSGLYTQASGTSLSSPHTAGVLALLLNAFPGLSTESQAAALMNNVTDLGASGADNDFGYGMLDALAAYNWLAAGNRATPTPLPTATATPAPTATPTPSPVIDQIFADGFESGDLSKWSSAVTDGGRLSVSALAAQVGAQGMQALISSTRPIYVADTSPAAEATYHARFYFSPHGVGIPRNKPHDIFVGRTSTGNGIFRLQLQLSSGNYQLRGIILLGNGKTVTTSWYTISNASHAIEIAWQAASTSKGSDGLFSLWVDGTLKETRTGIANGGYRLEDVLLGPQNIAAGTTGSEYFDAFSSTKTSYIGP